MRNNVVHLNKNNSNSPRQRSRKYKLIGVIVLSIIVIVLVDIFDNYKTVSPNSSANSQCQIVTLNGKRSTFDSGKHYSQAGDLQNAEYCFAASVSIAEAEKNYPTLRDAQVELGQTLRLQSKNTPAISVLESAKNIHNLYLSEDKDYLEYINNQLAKAYSSNSQYEKALTLYHGNMAYVNETGKANSILAGTISLDIGETLTRLGDLPGAMGKLEKAESLFVRDASQKNGFSRLMNAKGIVESKRGNFKTALGYYSESLDIREKYFPQKLYDIAEVKNNMGLVYKELGDCPAGLEFLKSAEAIYNKLYGDNSPDIISIKNNMSLCYLTLGDFGMAKDQLESALRLSNTLLPEFHITRANIYGNLSSVYQELGETTLSCDHKKKAYDIFLQVLGPSHEDTINIMDELKRCLRSAKGR